MSSRIVIATDSAAAEPVRWRRLSTVATEAEGGATPPAAQPPVTLRLEQPRLEQLRKEAPIPPAAAPSTLVAAQQARIQALEAQVQQLQSLLTHREAQARQQGLDAGRKEGHLQGEAA